MALQPQASLFPLIR